MTPERWQRIDELFGLAVQLPASERRPFVEAQAVNDPGLATELLNMLARDERSSFLDAGAAAMAGDVLPDPLADGIGPYRLKRCLGQGGMGVVYLAEHITWGTPVAIKVPGDAWISPDRKERFLAEQRVLAQLIHPAIARIYEGGAGPNGTPWFAMEFVEGQPITAYARDRNLSVEDRLQLFRQTCEAVQYAHSQAIIHRDLKPSNIFVTAKGQVKLLDFGIAKQLEEIGSGMTRTGAHPLTIAYAAPEQVSVNRISIQSDVYSLGVTLYELLTDHLPFDLAGLTPSQAEQIISTKIPERASISSALPLKRTEWADLDVLVLKSLHKDVAQRYGSVDALIRDLDHFLRREPLDARPDSIGYRLRKFIQRRRSPVIASAAALLLILSMVAYFTWRLARTRDEALAEANRARQIQQFMNSLFQGGDPVNGPSKDLRVIDMLSTGVDKASQFNNEPLVQAELYNTLGTVYRFLGQFDRAGSLFQLALARFQPGTRDYAETLVNIGLLENERGLYQQADATMRKALNMTETLSPPDPLAVARNKSSLADVLIHETRYPEALSLLNAAEAVQSKRTDAYQDWMDTLNLKVNVYIQLHQLVEAERLTRFLIALDRGRNPKLRRDDTNDIINLGEIQEARFEYATAAQTYREALQILEAWLPAGHPEIANTRRILAQALEADGKYDEASSVARQALSELERTYGHWHRRVAYTLRLLAHLAMDRHDYPEARADSTREIEIYNKIGNTADLPTALSNLADVDVIQKNYRSAESLYEESVRRFPSTEWSTGIGFAHAQMALGELKLRARQYHEAEPLLLASLALWKKQPPSKKDRTAETLSDLVKTYDGLHQPDKAAAYRQQLAAFEKH